MNYEQLLRDESRRSASRFATHGMCDIVETIAKYIAMRAVSFCQCNGVTFILWRDHVKYYLQRHVATEIYEYAGIAAGTTWVQCSALDELDMNASRVELCWSSYWIPSIWVARNGKYECVTFTCSSTNTLPIGRGMFLLPTAACMVCRDQHTRRVAAATIRVSNYTRVLQSCGRIDEYPTEYFLQSSLVHD